MLRVVIENEKGELLLLSNEVKFSISSITGLNPPAATLVYSDNINDGSQFQHQRTPKRNVVINMQINGDVESNRLELYNYVQTGKYIKIYIETYQRNVWIDGYVETCEVDSFQMKTTCQISVICGDPWWKDFVQSINSLEATKGMFYFPYYTITPRPVGIKESIQLLNLINKGNVPSGMTIEITAKGQVVNPIIYNRETREYIGIGNEEKPFEMVKGDKVIITTYSNNKKITLIRNAVETNIFNYLIEGSKFLQVNVGENILTFSTDSGSENLSISFKHYSQYKGV